jgi:hypothetical protein
MVVEMIEKVKAEAVLSPHEAELEGQRRSRRRLRHKTARSAVTMSPKC